MSTHRKATLMANLIAAHVYCASACNGYDSKLLERSDSHREGVIGVETEPDSSTDWPVEDAASDSGQDISLADGLPCEGGVQCESLHCEGGRCCREGRCCEQSDDCVRDGEPALVCDDPVRCQGMRHEFECSEHRCVARDQEDDSACDATVEASGCDLYAAVLCNGDADQVAPVCPDACGADEACDASAHCEAEVCMLDVDDGGACRRDGQCATGHCNAGVCCAKGDCCARASDCPARYSTPAACDDRSNCQGTRVAAKCAESMCASEQLADDSACTRSTLALTCDAYADVFCDGGQAQQEPACRRNCASGSDCDSDAHCSDGRCERDRANGQECDASFECASQYCDGGYCCSAGECCVSDDDCDDVYSCLDAGTCQGVVQEHVCAANFQCQEGERRADASGCAGQLARSCGPYRDVRCPATTFPISPSCATSCSSRLECNPGYTCDGGSCAIAQ